MTLVEDTQCAVKVGGDKRALKQVLINLLTNAVKFTPAGGTVTLRTIAAPDQVRISIEDSGIGIPEKDIDKLGRPFEQVENQMTKSRSGSGLGLAISKIPGRTAWRDVLDRKRRTRRHDSKLHPARRRLAGVGTQLRRFLLVFGQQPAGELFPL